MLERAMPTMRAEARQPLLLACCVVLVALAACTRGYPEADAPRVSPFDQSNDERLAALNELARQAHPERRWSYSMGGPCELSVEYRRKGQRPLQTTSKLVRTMDADLVFDKQDQTYDVVLLASSHREAQPIATVLESTAWTDASKAALYLTLLIRDCKRPS